MKNGIDLYKIKKSYMAYIKGEIIFNVYPYLIENQYLLILNQKGEKYDMMKKGKRETCI